MCDRLYVFVQPCRVRCLCVCVCVAGGWVGERAYFVNPHRPRRHPLAIMNTQHSECYTRGLNETLKHYKQICECLTTSFTATLPSKSGLEPQTLTCRHSVGKAAPSVPLSGDSVYTYQ